MDPCDSAKLRAELMSLIKLAQDPDISPVAKEVILLQIKTIQDEIFRFSPL